MDTRIRWGRIVLNAFLLELAISLIVTPFGLIYGNPLNVTPGGPGNTTPYLVSAAVGCAVMGFIFGRWTATKAGSQHALHGLLLGFTAMALYIGLGTLAPGGLSHIITAYGVGLYVLFNVLRTLGCWAGGWWAGRQRG